MTTSEYLASITKRCSHMTAEEMMLNLEAELERSRLGYGNYLFDERHNPFTEWSAPGILDYSLMKCAGGFEVVFTASPFEKEEMTVNAEEGVLEVAGVHEETDEGSGSVRTMRTSRRVPLPVDVDLEGIHAKYSEGTLIIMVPRPTKAKRMVEIE
jgi:HSP20 family molecular chaperone IbpA